MTRVPGVLRQIALALIGATAGRAQTHVPVDYVLPPRPDDIRLLIDSPIPHRYSPRESLA